MLKTFGAFFTALIVALAAYAEQSFIFGFERGDVEYYLYSASSACQIASIDEITKDASKFFSIKGSCIKGVDKAYVDEFIEKYDAETVSLNCVEGSFSVYMYSDKIRGYKLVNGKKVNIHVVKNEGGYQIAAPIIFGAY